MLYPDTSVTDWNILEEKILLYMNNENERFNVINYAWKKLNDVFSFNAVRNNINTFLGEIK